MISIGERLTGQDNMVPLGAYNFHVAFSTNLFENVSVAPPAPPTPAEGGTPGDTAAKEAPPAPPPYTRDAVIGGFSEVSGLEASMEPKAIRSGGDNYRVHQRVGATSFGTVTLKRGLVTSRHLWAWWSLFSGADHPERAPGGIAKNGQWAGTTRPDVSIMLVDNDVVMLGWRLERALPVKFRIGTLDAGGGELAIEELHLAHQGLHMMLPNRPAGGAA